MNRKISFILALLIGSADIHAAAALTALNKSGEYAVVSPCVGTLTALHLARDKLERLTVDDRLVHILDDDPVLRLFRANPADLEFVLRLLRRYRSDVNRIRENVLNRREVPDKPSVFGIKLFELRVDIAKSLLPVPPSRAWYLLVL